MRVAAVIPNKNGAGLIGRCVEAALAAGVAQVIVVDDGSTDESPREAEQAGAELTQSPGRGFAAAVNEGVRHATGEALLILNSDCFVQPDSISRIAAVLTATPGIGLCGAGLVELDGTPAKAQAKCLTLGLAIRTALSLTPRTYSGAGSGVEDVEFVPLACAVIRRSAWDEVAGLDERFFFYFEDQDICRRLHSCGWRLVVDWAAAATHVGGASSLGRDKQRWFLQYVRSRARYLRKHYPYTWPVFAAVWVPAALIRAAAWALRSGPSSRGWARTWLTAAGAGVKG